MLLELHGVPVALHTRVVAAVAASAEAQLDAFPQNIFWDFDAVISHVLETAMGAEDPGETLETASAGLAALMTLFGRETAIRFRYVHDFMYGFDWAAWVRRDPATRASQGPFSETYVTRTMQRGHELLSLIAEDDAKYPQIPDGTFRNPFGFTRDPSQEEQLFRDLAARDLIPIEAWRHDAVPRFDRAYADLRDERAGALGIRR